MTPDEPIVVNSPKVSCDGGGGSLGHPTIYLEIREDKREICCPYCSRHFVLSDEAVAAAGH